MVDDFLERVGGPLDILADSTTVGIPAVVDHLKNIQDNTDPAETEDIGSLVSDAIISGFGSANVNVTVVVNGDTGLVTE